MSTVYLIFSNDWFASSDGDLGVRGTITQTISGITVTYFADETMFSSGQSPIEGYTRYGNPYTVEPLSTADWSEFTDQHNNFYFVYEHTSLVGETDVAPTQTTVGTLAYTYGSGNYEIGVGYSSTTTGYIYYPTLVYEPVTVPDLFTAQSDVVDFNNLTSSQVTAIQGGAYLYDTLAGNDAVTLPGTAAASNVSGAAAAPVGPWLGRDSIGGLTPRCVHRRRIGRLVRSVGGGVVAGGSSLGRRHRTLVSSQQRQTVRKLERGPGAYRSGTKASALRRLAPQAFDRNRCERGTWEYRARAARLAELGGVVG